MPPLPQPLGFLPPHSVPRSVAELASRAGPLPLCADNGNLDMYGLGIRLAFYIQWYTLIACYLFQRVAEIHTVRLALNCFLSANFLALLIQTGRKVLSPIDTYITLVLYFGFYLSSIPVFMWRLLTRFDPAFDPTRWHLVRISKLDKAFHRVLVVSAAGFQLYFWTTVVPFADLDKCISHGFFLTKMPLDSDTLRTINTAAQVLVGFIYVFSPVVASLISENTHQGDTASTDTAPVIYVTSTAYPEVAFGS
ncbi:hypothetical protein QBC35DRAFT_501629 [Podospora australis]|uniref:Uncharacterized protein n=1 Tax=Podospora australis TaxID=1536484 RepID=A0AAN6WRX0_9PEZI|nr:hypothetical protein QBC35DRAFT_501629 [Podospora australis]